MIVAQKKITTTMLIFFGILALGIALRAWGLHEQSLTSDELLELAIAKKPMREIVHEPDGFPPLYHLVLHVWLKIFSEDLAARTLSLVFGVLAIVAMWKLAPWLENRSARLWATFLLAVSPLHVWYSQEARAYALYFLAALLALGFLARTARSNRWQDWSAYAVAALAGIYTHYYFAIFLLLGCAFFLLEKRDGSALKRAALLHGAMAICTLPALVLLIGDISYQTGAILARTPFSFVAFGYTFFAFLTGFSAGPALRELHMLPQHEAILAALPWVALLAASVLVLLFNSRKELSNKHWWLRVAVWSALPVLLCGALAETLVLCFKLQYVLWAAIPLFLVLGHMLATSFAARSTRLACLALCFLFGVSLYNRRTVAVYQNDDAKALATLLKSQSERSTPILVMACYMTEPLRYYLGNEWNILPLPDVGFQAQHLEEVLHKLAPLHAADSDYWLVYTRPYHGDPTGKFKQTILAQDLVQAKARLAGIELYQRK